MMTRTETMQLGLSTLDAMPVKMLGAFGFFPTGIEECGCALGEMARPNLLPWKVGPATERSVVEAAMDTLRSMGVHGAQYDEIRLENDRAGESPSDRWKRMRAWFQAQLDAERSDS